MFEWISQNSKDLENVSPSLSLCFGVIDDVKDLLFHHLLLIARHYIYTCRLGNKLPTLQVYIQVLMNSIEIEKQIAFHNNDAKVFERKWSRFQLRTFHFKLLHRRIATNDFLKKISLVQSDKCCFCEHETETITHLFLRCSITQSFWNDINQFLFQIRTLEMILFSQIFI